MQQINS
jgi:hypothetical protein